MKINPNHYSKICPITGLIVFSIKEYLEYYGIIVSTKTNANIALSTCESIINYLNELKEKVQEMIIYCE